MQAEVASYLDEVRTHLHLDPRTESRVISELYTHLQDKVSELQDNGVPEAQATRLALDAFGGARSIARLMYEAYSRGSWMEALISCQPHMIIAALFATHVWRQPILLVSTFAAIVLIALLGWRKGTPPWLYSWIGYAVFPFLILTFASWDPVVRTVRYITFGSGTPAPLWQLALLGALCICTIWLVAATTVQIAKRDWIFVSLMLLPLPVLVIWLFTVNRSEGYILDALRGFEGKFSRWDTAMAYFCSTLGMASVLFVRIRQRVLKAGAVFAVGIVGGAAAVKSIWGLAGVFGIIALSFAFLAFLSSPFLLRALVGREGETKQAFSP